ncbi:MAG: RDD family protein [Oscillochloris sp.]|nr:RDD family protein [Oscillochloris sp.]
MQGNIPRLARLLALPGRRVGAYLLDILVLFAVLAPTGQVILRLFGIAPPRTGPELASVILWNFSLPAWLYFILSDRSSAGMSPGKRLLNIQVRNHDGGRVSAGQAVVRTSIKLLPWELVHIFAFAIAGDFSRFRPIQTFGVTLANLLIIVYLGVTIATRGRRSVHDYPAKTLVAPREP